MKKHSEFITSKMMSQETGLSLRTIQRWCRTGQITCRKLGRLYFVERSEWEEFKARNLKAA